MSQLLYALGSPHLHQLLRRQRGWTVEQRVLTDTSLVVIIGCLAGHQVDLSCARQLTEEQGQ